MPWLARSRACGIGWRPSSRFSIWSRQQQDGTIDQQEQAEAGESPISGTRRAPYCMMGVCFECLAEVDGQGSTQTCLVIVRDGMQVRRQRGRPGMLG